MMSIKMQNNLIVIVVGIVALPTIASALKCYVCQDQDDNTGKCLTTVKICGYGQDRCLTDVKWGSIPYWAEGVEMQYYVSKYCSNQSYCDTLRQQYVSTCERIWYEDWKCMDCCQGDLCNYYVTLSAGTYLLSPFLLLFSLWTTFIKTLFQ